MSIAHYLLMRRSLLVLGLAVLLGAPACNVTIGHEDPAARAAPEAREGTRGGTSGTKRCCVWLDLDNTLNTLGAWGYPFNPVPAHEVCNLLAAQGAGVQSTPLTARGALLGFQPGEKECKGLNSTVSVKLSSGKEAARAKQLHMRSQDAVCTRHVLIDDNKAGAQIQTVDKSSLEKIQLAAPYIYIEPLATAAGWAKTKQQIQAALQGCGLVNPGGGGGQSNPPPPSGGGQSNPPPPSGGGQSNPTPPSGGGQSNPPPQPSTGSCQGFCGKQSPGGCYCDGECGKIGDCCADLVQFCGSGSGSGSGGGGGGNTPAGSCQGFCGKQSPGGCYCDGECGTFGDCCGDLTVFCGWA